jgi:hypothetical protein
VFPFSPYVNGPETDLRYAVGRLWVPLDLRPPPDAGVTGSRWRHQRIAFAIEVGRAPTQPTPDDRPGLVFQEDWRETPAATPVTQEHVAHPEVIVTRHGPGEAHIKKRHHEKPADDPYYIWSGLAKGTWAISLRHTRSLIDLSGAAKIRWRAKQSGSRQLRIVLRLANDTWIVSDRGDDQSDDWRVREFDVGGIRWRRLDVANVIERDWERKPDLTRVDEIGFTDLMEGGGSPASSRLDWIEVYGKAVPRDANRVLMRLPGSSR